MPEKSLKKLQKTPKNAVFLLDFRDIIRKKEQKTMNFMKKMCILRQLKQGFSGDGRPLSGLIKIEQYGKNLSVEISVIGFAPLASGEYYCLIADCEARTEMLPLRGKSLFNVVSELDISGGFCGIVCFVKNGIFPIAYGINGNLPYDWRTLVQSPILPKSEKTETASGYDDEHIAEENYFREETHERIEHEQTDTYAYAESRAENGKEKGGKNAETNGDAQSVREAFTTDSNGYYLAVKAEIDELFKKYPKDDSLKSTFPYSEWARVKGEEGNAEYLIGVIYEELTPRYICYALPAADRDLPPEEIAPVCTFVPSNAFSDSIGFFVIFQSCATGECVKIENE